MGPLNDTRLPSIANLMSPPESKPLDSFRPSPSKSPLSSYRREFTPEDKLPPMRMPDTKMKVLPSPPISPWQDRNHRQEKGLLGHKRKSSDLKDPPLYADSETGSNYEEPLFHPKPVEPTDEIINRHIDLHMAQFKYKLNQPTREEYKLALGFVTQIGARYNTDPAAYVKRQREEQENEYHQTKRICAEPGIKPRPVAIAPAPKSGKRAIKAMTPKQLVPRVRRTPKASPRSKLLDYEGKGRAGTPGRQSGQKKVADKDYNAIKDYSPPTVALQNASKLFAKWTSSQGPLDLSNDPDRHMIPEQEVLHVASPLRLTCAQYLTQKRRIFRARVKKYQKALAPDAKPGTEKFEFRKTDAQEACKIDVNKASELHQAYDRVGWFNLDLFEQYRDEVIE